MDSLLINLIFKSIKSSTELVLISLLTNLKEFIVFSSQKHIFILWLLILLAGFLPEKDNMYKNNEDGDELFCQEMAGDC